ncbi:hypothetical protein [Streptomyces sp. bgisy031]|uniref:hypothetical protein n=1 Tax=Streptomyces sp. bgisy031 TaxID=3413772 RepID=UPI003D74C239
MTGPEHYREAEFLLAESRNELRPNDEGHCEADRTIAEAQVHATLAHAAATAMGAPVDGEGDSGLPPRDCSEWYRVAGVKPRKDGEAR